MLESQGFTVSPIDDWSVRAERGSIGASTTLGAFAGKEGRHVILDTALRTNPDGTMAITLTQGTSGMPGGLIGMNQAMKLYGDIFNTVGLAFHNAGVPFKGENI